MKDWPEQSAGTPLYKIDCPKCGGDNNQVFGHDDKPNDSYCYNCKEAFYNIEEGGMALEKYVTEGRMIKAKPFNEADYSNLPTSALEDRGLRKEIAALYGVKVGLSEVDGRTVTHHYYPDTKKGKLTGYEVRIIEGKKFSAVGDRKGALDLWGQALASQHGSNKLFITEGRCDAMALYQVIVDRTPAKYKAYLPSVVSLTRGATGGLKDIINNREFVEKYKEVVLVLDNDTAGELATKDILKSFNNFKVCKLPLKDANDMLLADRGKELYQSAVWDSVVERQGEVVDVDDALINEALTRPKMGLSYPWPTLTQRTYGIRPHTIVILGAAPKQGKSEFKNQLAHHLTIEHDRRVGIYDLEVHPVKTLKQIASKEAKTNFLRPDNEYDEALLRATLQKFKGKISLYDRAGSRDWADIRIAIEEQHLIDGVCEFFIDPLTALVSRFSSSEANDALNEILTDMADLVNKYPITIFAFSHLNPKARGTKSHEQGGKVLSSEFTGSRALEKWSNLGLGIERDRSDDCPEDKRNHSQVKILYCRDFGNYGSVDMFYNADTTEYLEPKRF